jgi:hypothetical protein
VGLRECRDSSSQTEETLLAPRVVKRRQTVPLLGLSPIFEGTARWQGAASSINFVVDD